VSLSFRKRGYNRLTHRLTVGERDDDIVVTLIRRAPTGPKVPGGEKPKPEDLRKPDSPLWR
jgi:hypothetical protein